MKPFYFILLCLAGWINREQQNVIQYLQEEVKVLKEIQPQLINEEGDVQHHERIGGLLNYYCRGVA